MDCCSVLSSGSSSEGQILKYNRWVWLNDHAYTGDSKCTTCHSIGEACNGHLRDLYHIFGGTQAEQFFIGWIRSYTHTKGSETSNDLTMIMLTC